MQTHMFLDLLKYVRVRMINKHRRTKDIRIDLDVTFGGGKPKEKRKEDIKQVQAHARAFYAHRGSKYKQ